MEKNFKLANILNIQLDWNTQQKKTVPNLELPESPTIFPSVDKNLCESGVDLICSRSTVVCSG